MSKAGGILGIIAGIFGFIAAIITLMFGGIGSAFNVTEASTVVGLGYGGIIFSFAVIVCAAIIFAKPKQAGIALIVCSILGAVLGGTIVAICMVLSLIGGVLAMIGAKSTETFSNQLIESQPTKVFNTVAVTNGARKSHLWIYTLGTLVALALLAYFVLKTPTVSKADPLAELVAAQPSELQPGGELEQMFAFGSNFTDLQREKRFNEIKDQVVLWQLPVFDVKRNDDVYRVQTSSRSGFAVGTFVTITPRSDKDRAFIEALKTGEIITFKGRIADTTMRSFDINPAILVNAAEKTSQTNVPPESITSDAKLADASENSDIAVGTNLDVPTAVESDGFSDEASAWLKKHPDVEKCADKMGEDFRKDRKRQGLSEIISYAQAGEFIGICARQMPKKPVMQKKMQGAQVDYQPNAKPNGEKEVKNKREKKPWQDENGFIHYSDGSMSSGPVD